MTKIIIGTTPTITYTFHTVSVSDLTKAILTIKCNGQVILEKTLADAVVGENSLSWTLTQQDKADIAGLVDVPVDDVQINGVSAVSGGVANIPVASTDNYGVVKINQYNGVRIVSGNLATYPSTAKQVKAGTDASRPIEYQIFNMNLCFMVSQRPQVTMKKIPPLLLEHIQKKLNPQYVRCLDCEVTHGINILF